MHGYTYIPKILFHGIPKDINYLGIELEVPFRSHQYNIIELSDTLTTTFDKDENLFYNKYDASINNGFEIVSHPFTLSTFKKEFPLKEMLLFLIQNGAMERSQHGLHVHLNRAAFCEKDLIKIRYFFHSSAHYLSKLSRRTKVALNSWASLQPFITDSITNLSAEYKLNQCQSVGRHAIYIPNKIRRDKNKNTIEVRLFNMSLKYNTIIADMEFCDSLFTFIPQHSIVSCTWPKYIKFLEKTQQYSILKKHLKRKELM